MSQDARLAQSFAYCKEIIRRQAQSFYLSSLFLPRDKQEDVFALYAFYRTVDDLVDERSSTCSPLAVVRELDAWRTWLQHTDRHLDRDPVRPALAAVIEKRRIPLQYLNELLDGVQSDLYPCQLQTFAELERYCYLVAGTVGLVMSYVLGVRDQAALVNARSLGIAMQLTNVLRDIGEDQERGMIYLPADEMAAFGYSAERLALRRVDSDFIALMRMQIGRARDQYHLGIDGISALARDSQFPILLAAKTYGTILRKIEVSGYDVFSRRVHTRLPEKLWIAGHSYLGHKLLGVATIRI